MNLEISNIYCPYCGQKTNQNRYCPSCSKEQPINTNKHINYKIPSSTNWSPYIIFGIASFIKFMYINIFSILILLIFAFGKKQNIHIKNWCKICLLLVLFKHTIQLIYF